ncbi:hypothetical protein [Sandaracinus amylolyticus]|uniref:hypothetical protein n=1 Tax=Sandaracinus amylolyticus TaxID=927083 RepID=UPI00069EA0BC|nr:hypothetical protein [Sandaracinus amylolyticus]
MSARLEDPEELLFRQVPSAFLVDGRLSSQAFNPSRKDEQRLSVSRGSLTTAQAAYDHHTLRLGHQSLGTWAVTVGEVVQVGLHATGDPVMSPPAPTPDPAHAFIDFTGLSLGQTKNKATRLAELARARGRLWPPSGGETPARDDASNERDADGSPRSEPSAQAFALAALESERAELERLIAACAADDVSRLGLEARLDEVRRALERAAAP